MKFFIKNSNGKKISIDCKENDKFLDVLPEDLLLSNLRYSIKLNNTNICLENFNSTIKDLGIVEGATVSFENVCTNKPFWKRNGAFIFNGSVRIGSLGFILGTIFCVTGILAPVGILLLGCSLTLFGAAICTAYRYCKEWFSSKNEILTSSLSQKTQEATGRKIEDNITLASSSVPGPSDVSQPVESKEVKESNSNSLTRAMIQLGGNPSSSGSQITDEEAFAFFIDTAGHTYILKFGDENVRFIDVLTKSGHFTVPQLSAWRFGHNDRGQSGDFTLHNLYLTLKDLKIKNETTLWGATRYVGAPTHTFECFSRPVSANVYNLWIVIPKNKSLPEKNILTSNDSLFCFCDFQTGERELSKNSYNGYQLCNVTFPVQNDDSYGPRSEHLSYSLPEKDFLKELSVVSVGIRSEEKPRQVQLTVLERYYVTDGKLLRQSLAHSQVPPAISLTLPLFCPQS